MSFVQSQINCTYVHVYVDMDKLDILTLHDRREGDDDCISRSTFHFHFVWSEQSTAMKIKVSCQVHTGIMWERQRHTK